MPRTTQDEGTESWGAGRLAGLQHETSSALEKRFQVRERQGGAGDFNPGVYRITFGTGAYFTTRGMASFYPEVTITFEMTARDEHYHVPLLLSPYAYSTYRGS